MCALACAAGVTGFPVGPRSRHMLTGADSEEEAPPCPAAVVAEVTSLLWSRPRVPITAGRTARRGAASERRPLSSR